MLLPLVLVSACAGFTPHCNWCWDEEVEVDRCVMGGWDVGETPRLGKRPVEMWRCEWDFSSFSLYPVGK